MSYHLFSFFKDAIKPYISKSQPFGFTIVDGTRVWGGFSEEPIGEKVLDMSEGLEFASKNIEKIYRYGPMFSECVDTFDYIENLEKLKIEYERKKDDITEEEKENLLEEINNLKITITEIKEKETLKQEQHKQLVNEYLLKLVDEAKNQNLSTIAVKNYNIRLADNLKLTASDIENFTDEHNLIFVSPYDIEAKEGLPEISFLPF